MMSAALPIAAPSSMPEAAFVCSVTYRASYVYVCLYLLFNLFLFAGYLVEGEVSTFF